MLPVHLPQPAAAVPVVGPLAVSYLPVQAEALPAAERTPRAVEHEPALRPAWAPPSPLFVLLSVPVLQVQEPVPHFRQERERLQEVTVATGPVRRPPVWPPSPAARNTRPEISTR